MENISCLKASHLIHENEGKIFKATFRKKNGKFRRMVCRLGVTKGITGKGMKYNPKKFGLLPVFEMQKCEYRMINLKTLIFLTLRGRKYRIM